MADQQVEELRSVSDEHRLAPYQAIALGLRGQIALQLGDIDSARSLLEASLQALRQVRHEMLIGIFSADLASALSASGRHSEAKAGVASAIAMVIERAEGIYLPELYRLQAVVFTADPGSDPRVAQAVLEMSLSSAREQEALACELRAMSTLVELQRRRRRDPDGEDQLRGLAARFVNEPEFADLRKARALLAQTS